MSRFNQLLAKAALAVCGFGSVQVSVGAVLPPGFFETVVFQDTLFRPTAIRFAPDGRVFVIEKFGAIKVFSSVTDTTPELLIDLGDRVHGYLDRGLLGLEIDPQFATRPYIYVLYTYNFDPKDPGQPAPRWPQFSCPDPPGGETDGCVVTGRLSRFEVAANNTVVGSEQILLENQWCHQFPSHAIGGLSFGSDGSLYVSAGDGANYLAADYGQFGGGAGSPTPRNPCDDPPAGRGGVQTPPDAEGGALRSQDLQSGNDPVSYEGAILRVDPDTGAALPTNPLFGGEPTDDRVVAFGLRNPFRITIKPGTSEVWVGDVGWGAWEEINRVPSALTLPIENFGWPCFEGPVAHPSYDAQDLSLCESLYSSGNSTLPYYAYNHDLPVDVDPGGLECSRVGSSSVTGLAFYAANVYPSSYQNALFFADYSRRCIFVMYPDASGNPDPSTRTTFADQAASPVDLQLGPDGLLYYVDLESARVLRINYTASNIPPTARASSDKQYGALPLIVQFDGSGSSDPDPDSTLNYAWDLDGDGSFDDSTAISPTYTYTTAGEYLVTLRVSDQLGGTDTDTLRIIAGNTPPSPTITAPAATVKWKVGDLINFRGQATDAEQGAMPPASMSWEMVLYHCPGGPNDCHPHPLEQFVGVDHGSFYAPDHEYYAYIDIILTVTDAGLPGGVGKLSATAKVAIEARPSDLTFTTDPPGFQLVVGPDQVTAPVSTTVIAGSLLGVSALTPQEVAGDRYVFAYWSDGGAASHTIKSPADPTSYTAVYAYDGPVSDWWDLAWRRRIKLPIDNASSPQGHSNFPLLVTLESTRIDYSKTKNAGEDIRFIDSNGVTLLAHEIDTWDEAGRSLVWVNVPAIDPASNIDFIWLYYDNLSAADGQNVSGVWDNSYRGVWHLSPDLTDSTASDNDSSNNFTSDVSGFLGRGRRFLGNGWLDIANASSLQLTGSATFEAWVKIDDPNRSSPMRVLSKKFRADSTNGYELVYHPQQNAQNVVSSGTNFGGAAGVDLDTGWHHLAATIQGTTAELYLDGVVRTSDNQCNALVAGSQPLAIGRRSGIGDYFLGSLDEIRISGTQRSSAWIAAQHRSMTDTFLTYTAPEDACGPNDRSCNSRDDDCDGLLDDDAPAPFPVAQLQVTSSSLSWQPRTDATLYDLVRGDLGVLLSSAGDFTVATSECVTNDTSATTVTSPATPAAGNAFWYLVRGVNCRGGGSYDDPAGGMGAVVGRDAEIGLASARCP